MFDNGNCHIDPPLLSPFYFYVINFILNYYKIYTRDIGPTTGTILNWKNKPTRKYVHPILEQAIYLHNM